MAEHLLEMAGALVRIRDGKIEVLTDPRVRRCPLRQDIYGIEAEDRESVAQVLRQHMQELGMYGPERVLELQERTVSFGASEILADGLNDGLVDAAVVVCEGAGTVIISRPDVLQAVGAHMVGLVKTDPIEEIQEGLEKRGCILLDRQGSIDQVRGLELAAAAGFERIAVTIAGKDTIAARRLRQVGGGWARCRSFSQSTPREWAMKKRRCWQNAATWSGPAPPARFEKSWGPEPGCRWASLFPSSR